MLYSSLLRRTMYCITIRAMMATPTYPRMRTFARPVPSTVRMMVLFSSNTFLLSSSIRWRVSSSNRAPNSSTTFRNRCFSS
uniref:Putative secreted peptide n=1 Tax=Anopheles braziliensis TaxID=58242 RepID=A0A2M3ZU89_9DIPT